jgi:hypothetical protein
MNVINQLQSGHDVPISTIPSQYGTIQLFLTTHTPESDIDWDKEYTILTDCYEFGTSEGNIEYDLTHNIARDDGWVFRFTTPNGVHSCEARFISILTDRGPNGEIIVPDDPYDEGNFQLTDGVYRLYETKES